MPTCRLLAVSAHGDAPLSGATEANHRIRHLLWELADVGRDEGCHPHAAVVTVDPVTAALLGAADEVRGYVSRGWPAYAPLTANNPLTFYGCPSRLYGFPVRLNEAQPVRTLDLVWDDLIVTYGPVE